MKAVIVRKNVSGNGSDVQNSAVFCTRHKFTPYCGAVDGDDIADGYIRAVAAIDGLCGASAFRHDGAYDLWVRKATAFDWSEIEPAVMAILEARHEELSALVGEAAETTRSENTTKPPNETLDSAEYVSNGGPRA